MFRVSVKKASSSLNARSVSKIETFFQFLAFLFKECTVVCNIIIFFSFLVYGQYYYH
jgi:hypothetical protein